MRICDPTKRSAHARCAALAALVATVALTGCSSSSPASSPLSSPSSSTGDSAGAHSSASAGAAHDAASITIKNFAFHVSGTVMPAATVRITNDDSIAHTVTADSGHAFDVTIAPSKSATLTAPRKTGTYKFHCNFHSDMHGTLTIR
jgi:plastocyanin